LPRGESFKTTQKTEYKKVRAKGRDVEGDVSKARICEKKITPLSQPEFQLHLEGDLTVMCKKLDNLMNTQGRK
jgi:hypothetical protein